jgi:hypothetical protein
MLARWCSRSCAQLHLDWRCLPRRVYDIHLNTKVELLCSDIPMSLRNPFAGRSRLWSLNTVGQKMLYLICENWIDLSKRRNDSWPSTPLTLCNQHLPMCAEMLCSTSDTQGSHAHGLHVLRQNAYLFQKGNSFLRWQVPHHLDEDVHPDGTTFNGFRFIEIREEEGEGTENQIVATSLDYLAVGHRKHP